MTVEQWRSQALKSGWAQGRSPGGVWGRSPQKPDIYRQFTAVKCFLYAGLFPSSSSLSLQKNSLDLPTRPGQGGHKIVFRVVLLVFVIVLIIGYY